MRLIFPKTAAKVPHMNETVLIIMLLVLVVAIVAVRYIELRDLVKAISKQTEALSLYLSEQYASRVEMSAGLRGVQESCVRIENKVDALHTLLRRFDRRKTEDRNTETAAHE